MLIDDLKKAVKDVIAKIYTEKDSKGRSLEETQELAEKAVTDFFAKKEEAAPQDKPTAEQTYDIDEIIAKIDRDYPALPTIKLTPVRREGLTVFDSKLGGVPYMPKDFEYPKGKSGDYEGMPLRLLAQLNFGELPHIADFPEKGILQFFCADADDWVYGLDFDKPTSANGFRVIYHENIITDESQLMTAEDIPETNSDEDAFPFKGEFAFDYEVGECPISEGDYHFFDSLLKYCGEVCGKELKTYRDIENAGFGKFYDKLYESRTFEQSCIGGYPFFTQDDPRGWKEDISDYNILLFQCASFYDKETKDEIMWGDMGVANFFISSEDLKKRDFSKVAYNWDCG